MTGSSTEGNSKPDLVHSGSDSESDPLITMPYRKLAAMPVSVSPSAALRFVVAALPSQRS